MDKLRFLLLFSFTIPILMLSGCSSTIKRDGPPKFYVDETKIPNAVPKAEPKAKYGNMASYRVFGKRYYVMKSNVHYDEIGIASWYGTQFHAKRTSSGEPYNMLGMTAAHKTLPLPTYVQVTNLNNGKKIIVKVNDRGPFATGRIIDLSYVAAKKLGITGHGTAKVRVTAINPNQWHRETKILAYKAPIKTIQQTVTHQQKIQTPSYQYLHTEQKENYYLQVGAFKDERNAIRLKNQLISYFRAPIQVQIPTIGQSFYRVQIGPFEDLISADLVSNQLKNLGFQSRKKYGV